MTRAKVYFYHVSMYCALKWMSADAMLFSSLRKLPPYSNSYFELALAQFFRVIFGVDIRPISDSGRYSTDPDHQSTDLGH